MQSCCSYGNQDSNAQLIAVTINQKEHRWQINYLDYLIDPSFRYLFWYFENIKNRTLHLSHFIPAVETKDYNAIAMYNWSTKPFDQPIKNNVKTNGSIQKITTGPSDDYPTSCFIDYNYFKDYYRMMAMELSK